MWRIVPFVLGLCLGLLSPMSAAQADDTYGYNRMDFMRMESEAHWRAIAEQEEAARQSKLQAELDHDKKLVAYTFEMANLWARLATLQNEYYSAKWNEQSIDIGKDMEIRLIKEELLRREKQTRNHLK